MARNARNILRHEFIGLPCEIAAARNKSQLGIRGTAIDETMKSIVIETQKGRKRVLKKGAVFRFTLPDAVVRVDGDYIIARPEDRIKKVFRKW